MLCSILENRKECILTLLLFVYHGIYEIKGILILEIRIVEIPGYQEILDIGVFGDPGW